MSAPLESPATSRVIEAWGFVWPVTVLFALTSISGWYYTLDRAPTIEAIADLAVVAIALRLLVRPRGARGLALLAVIQLGQAAIRLPELPNNAWIMMLLNLAFLANVGFSKGAGASADEAFRAFQRGGRAIVITCYAFAFFAKLNHDYLDPAASCAAQFYGNVGRWLPLPQEAWARSAVLWSTLLIEGLLPLALAFARGRWRTATVFAGIAFHFLLALDVVKSFVNFSAVMTAGLLLFLPPDRLAALAPAGGRSRLVRTAFALAFVALVACGILASRGAPLGAVFVFGRVILFAAFLVSLTVRIFAGATLPEPRRRLGVATALVLALAIANGLAPYVGWKTRTAFDMYSNLRLEADSSNHLLVPRSLDAFGLLADRVIVDSVADEDLRQKLPPGSHWPWLEFASHAARAEGRVVYVRDGIRTVHEPGEAAGIEAPPWVIRKLAVFRPFGESTRALCLW